MGRLPSRTGGGGQGIEVMARGIWQVGADICNERCRSEFGIEP
jgi:hypothetical protein